MKKIVFMIGLLLSTSLFRPMVSASKVGGEILKSLKCSSRKILIGATYQHYKGKLYEVMAIARHSEDPTSKLVVYKALYDSPGFGKNSVWVRPYDMFAEDIEIEGQRVPRFKIVDQQKADF